MLKGVRVDLLKAFNKSTRIIFADKNRSLGSDILMKLGIYFSIKNDTSNIVISTWLAEYLTHLEILFFEAFRVLKKGAFLFAPCRIYTRYMEPL